MLEEFRKTGKKEKWKNEQEVFEWWMQEKNIAGQMSLEDYNYG